jgi:predicted HTH transcriptional regulator
VLSSPTEDLISDGESVHAEFKQTATYNYHTGSKDSRIEHALIKSVAGFLNADGGVLLIGIHDDGYPVGLDPDFGICSTRKDRDGFENWFYTRLADQIGGPVVASFVRISFERINDCEICRVNVQPSPQPVYVGNAAEFFVRMGNSTRAYNPRDAAEYIRARWRSTAD